jgi:hypothetical protein
MSQGRFSDTDTFESKLNTIPLSNYREREALVDICDTIGFAKLMLLQHRVRDFQAADVIRVVELVINERNRISDALMSEV